MCVCVFACTSNQHRPPGLRESEDEKRIRSICSAKRLQQLGACTILESFAYKTKPGAKQEVFVGEDVGS